MKPNAIVECNAVFVAFLLGLACTVKSSVPLAINEVLPSNHRQCSDEKHEYDDWIELYNKGDEATDLGGYSLTDDTASPRKAVLPGGLTIDAKGFLLLWADGTPAQGKTHLSFKLSAEGEEVVLYDPNQRQVDLFQWTGATSDISYARIPDGRGAFVLCATPTCGTANSCSNLDSSVD